MDWCWTDWKAAMDKRQESHCVRHMFLHNRLCLFRGLQERQGLQETPGLQGNRESWDLRWAERFTPCFHVSLHLSAAQTQTLCKHPGGVRKWCQSGLTDSVSPHQAAVSGINSFLSGLKVLTPSLRSGEESKNKSLSEPPSASLWLCYWHHAAKQRHTAHSKAVSPIVLKGNCLCNCWVSLLFTFTQPAGFLEILNSLKADVLKSCFRVRQCKCFIKHFLQSCRQLDSNRKHQCFFFF